MKEQKEVYQELTGIFPLPATAFLCLGLGSMMGLDQLTYDFRVDGVERSIRVREHLADGVLPVVQRLG